MEATTAAIAVLPMEVLLAILSWIPPIDIVKRVKPVCKDWQRMCHFQDSLWGQWFRIFFPSCFDRQMQSQKGNDNDDEELWPCSACTFLNMFSTNSCVACLTEIPEIYASLHIGKKEAQEEVLADEAAKLIGPINQVLAIVLHSDLAASRLLQVLFAGEESATASPGADGSVCGHDLLKRFLLHDKREVRWRFGTLISGAVNSLERAREDNRRSEGGSKQQRSQVLNVGRSFIFHLISILPKFKTEGTKLGAFVAIVESYVALGPVQCKKLLSRGSMTVWMSFIRELQIRTGIGNVAEKKQLAQEMARFSNVISLVIRRCNPFPLSTEQALPPTFVPGPVLSLESLDSVIHDMAWMKHILRWQCPSTHLAHTLIHLSWQNENFSKEIVSGLLSYINIEEFERFPSAFELFDLLLERHEDGLHDLRSGVFLEGYQTVINDNLIYRGATKACLAHLQHIGMKFPAVRTWLQAHLDWLFLLAVSSKTHYTAAVAAAATLVSVVEGKQIADSDLATERLIAEEHYAAVEGLYQHLLECLPLQKERRERASGSSELCGYMMLLHWALQHQPNREHFIVNHFEDLTGLFELLDKQHQGEDQSKLSVLQVWAFLQKHHQLHITSTLAAALMDGFVSIRMEQANMEFNSMALPVYYGLMLSYCKHNPEFYSTWLEHKNFDWAIRFLFLDSSFPVEWPAHSIFVEMLQDACASSDAFKLKLISMTEKLTPNNKKPASIFNTVRAWLLALTSEQEALPFCAVMANVEAVLQLFVVLFKEPEQGQMVMQFLKQIRSLSALKQHQQWAQDKLKEFSTIILKK